MPIIKSTLTLKELPPPPSDKKEWPWTEQSQPLPERMSDGSEWPRISIVTPSYNQGQFIEETIRSVLLQGYPNLEYIIIDGGSNDNTIEIIKKYENYFSYWVSEPDKGPTDAINKGWQRTSGEIVAYLNSDDAYLPGTLATIAKTFQENCDARVVCGNELKIDSEGFVISESSIEKVDRLSLLHLNLISQPATFIKKSTLELTGGLNLDVHYIFDFELWLRITRLGSMQPIQRLLAVTRWHNDTITTTRRSDVGRELVQVISNELGIYPSSLTRDEIRQILFKANRLSMSLHLEKKKFFASIKYALRAFMLLSAPRLGLEIVQEYYRYLVKPIKSFLKKNKLDTSIGRQIHWSSIAKEIMLYR
ncbi:MAG TPA: glycosyltransferase [Cyanobacteria bacterium UBA8553]|nr:glycosyltransferase [Cyanobacteria bacterium UBA8553]